MLLIPPPLGGDLLYTPVTQYNDVTQAGVLQGSHSYCPGSENDTLNIYWHVYHHRTIVRIQ